jgi:hypothetical protein
VNTRAIGVLQTAAVALGLSLIAWLSPLPDRVTDRDVYEATAAQRIVPDCTDLHCFRVLVPWVLGALPGPSVTKWKTYAVLSNTAAAVAVFQLCLTLGFGRRAASRAAFATAFGFGSLYTLHDSFTTDPLMYAVGPLIVDQLLRQHVWAAGIIGTVAVLGKEFAAAPLYLMAAHAGLARRWTMAARSLVAANAAMIVWLLLQLTLMLRFNYGYGDNPSTHLLSGGFLAPWLAQQSLRGIGSALFNEYGALYLLAPVGFSFASAELRRLVWLALPIAAIFAYVQQPDRALWNFHFLVVPLAVLALERVPAALAWLTLATFALANLRVGAQLSSAPTARLALAASVLLAVASMVIVLRHRSTMGAPQPGVMS